MNRNTSWKISLGILLCLSACGKGEVDDGVYFQNFDNLLWWTRNASVSYEQVHSGGYSAYVDSAHEFSHTFEMDYEFAKEKKFRRAQITAWCFKPKREAQVGLVASLEAPGKQVAVASLDFQKDLEVSETWLNVVLFLDIPQQAPSGTKFKVYLYSPHGDKGFMDDVKISFQK